jgi:GNAT superfamily N-acetyltransferase
VIAWVFPTSNAAAVLPTFMEFRLRKLGFPHDQIWMRADGAAAAVWFPPPGTAQGSGLQRLRLVPPLARFVGLRTISVLGGLNRMEAQHPHDPPHWYLYIFGAEQAAQARGLGSALLAHTLAPLTPIGCRRIWSLHTSGTLRCTTATASRSPAS